MVGGFNHELVVDVAANRLLFDPHPERVPFTWTVVNARFLLQNRPGENRGAVEACEAKLAGAGIEPVMFLIAIRSENQSGGARLILQANRGGDFVRALRDRV